MPRKFYHSYNHFTLYSNISIVSNRSGMENLFESKIKTNYYITRIFIPYKFVTQYKRLLVYCREVSIAHMCAIYALPHEVTYVNTVNVDPSPIYRTTCRTELRHCY